MHKMSHTRLYREWKAMNARCRPTSTDRAHYYDRGISVCVEWRTGFPAFMEWALHNGYSDSMTIDRIDNDKGYSPDNCRWTSRQVNALNRNKHRNNKTGVKGVIFSNGRYRADIRFNGQRIYLGYYDSIDDAARARKAAEEQYMSLALLNARGFI